MAAARPRRGTLLRLDRLGFCDAPTLRARLRSHCDEERSAGGRHFSDSLKNSPPGNDVPESGTSVQPVVYAASGTDIAHSPADTGGSDWVSQLAGCLG
jgi:hypothetical protein